jgi:AhpD family alkylhydroperoxidase
MSLFLVLIRLTCIETTKGNDMEPRANFFELSGDLCNKLVELSQVKSSLNHALRNLIDIRASQINGCTFCLDMHMKQAKLRGEKELRLYHTSVWRESNLFNPKERAILELTELATKITSEGVSDSDYARLKQDLSDKEISDALFQIGIINTWNRLNVIFRSTPGSMDKAFGLDKAGL